jgi:zinc protease
MTKLIVLAVTCALCATAPLQAQPARGRISVPYEQLQLANGLTVILHRDTTTPTIATNIWYHTGSSSETPGRTGFAHLFEHIMFEGSKHVPEGKIDEWFEEVGGAPNGSTTQDRTNYMQSFSSNALDLALFIESDRMGYLLDAMSPKSVDGQRDVVKNERRQSYDNRPYGLANQLITEALYPPTHPYSWPVIGYMDHLTAASFDDVVNFFKRYYAPNNATLAIAGNIDIAQAKRLAEKWFAEVPRGAPIPPRNVQAPVLTEPRRIMLEDRVQLPRLYMTWVSPRAYQPQDAEMAVLARVLSSGKNSRLYRRLVYDLQIADDVSAGQDGSKLGGEFTIVATARAGHTLTELERVILEEIEKLKAEPPEARELERIVNQYESSFLEQLERAASKADLLNEYLYYTGTPDYFNQDIERFRRMKAADVTAAAKQFLNPNARVVLSIVPQGKPELAIPNSKPIRNENLELSPEARTRPRT